MGFRNTAVKFVNFFVQDRIAGIYLFLDDRRSSCVTNAYCHDRLEIQFVVRTDKPIIEAISISNSKSSISIAFRNHLYMI